MSNINNAGGNDQNNPWGWLGLLKWSLAQQRQEAVPDNADGNKNEGESKMSEEDITFLEKVMKEGIIDEGERMKEILRRVAKQIEEWKQQQEGEQEVDSDKKEEEEDDVLELLQELRDIVEQIDYARAFCILKGLHFLLGVVSSSLVAQANDDQKKEIEKEEPRPTKFAMIIPRSIQAACLGIIATLCQHNPPVQKQLLELGSIQILTDLFFKEMEDANGYCDNNNDGDSNHDNGKFAAKIMQAISANIRSYDLSESLFLKLEPRQNKLLIQSGLGMTKDQSSSFPLVLQKRTLVFMSSLLSSELCTIEYANELFSDSICYAIRNFMSIDNDNDYDELRESTVLMVEELFKKQQNQQKLRALQQEKDLLRELGLRRTEYIQSLSDDKTDEREFAAVEYESWKHIMHFLSSL